MLNKECTHDVTIEDISCNDQGNDDNEKHMSNVNASNDPRILFLVYLRYIKDGETLKTSIRVSHHAISMFEGGLSQCHLCVDVPHTLVTGISGTNSPSEPNVTSGPKY